METQEIHIIVLRRLCSESLSLREEFKLKEDISCIRHGYYTIIVSLAWAGNYVTNYDVVEVVNISLFI